MMIAGGVGLNLQVTNNILTVERQWNAADESQFEDRTYRYGQNKPVLSNFLIADGFPTEDFFTQMVERKRQTCGETLDGDGTSDQDKEAVMEMVYAKFSGAKSNKEKSNEYTRI